MPPSWLVQRQHSPEASAQQACGCFQEAPLREEKESPAVSVAPSLPGAGPNALQNLFPWTPPAALGGGAVPSSNLHMNI